MSRISGPIAAKNALVDLISDIRTSLSAAASREQSDYNTAVDKAQQELRAFMKATVARDATDTAEVDAIRDIDDVAFSLFVDLALGRIEANNAVLQAGAAKLAGLAARMDEVTAETDEQTAKVSLVHIKDAVDSMTGAIASVKALKDKIAEGRPDAAAIVMEIDKLAAQYERLRALL